MVVVIIGKMNNEKNVGNKYDDGKPDHTMYPKIALDEVAKVFEYGAEKYGRNNFKLVDDGRHRYVKAAFRHLLSEAEGESLDPESNRYHLAHAVCSCLMALYFALNEDKNE